VPVRAHFTGDSRNKTLLQVFSKDSRDRRTQANSLLSLNRAEKQFYSFWHAFIQLHLPADDSTTEFARRKARLLGDEGEDGSAATD
jgi:hypothetical protein